MEEHKKTAVIVAAIAGALDAIDKSEADEVKPATEPIGPHRFGHFQIPPDARVTGFEKLTAVSLDD